MTLDFTFEKYGEFLDSVVESGYAALPVRDYLARESLPDRFVILRHDVDRKPGNALRMARLEADRGVESTYYVRTVDRTFDPELIREIADLGHEVGYHYEDMDRADGDPAAAHVSFDAHLGMLRRVAPVDTVCMHGNPLTPHDNRDMWDGEGDFARYDLLGEAYLSIDFEDVTYFSDTGRTWRDGALKVKDYVRGPDEKAVQVDTTDELADLVSTGELERLCVLTHPNRWAETRRELVLEHAKDSAINLAKYGLAILP